MENIKKLIKYMRSKKLKLSFWTLYRVNDMEYKWYLENGSIKVQKYAFDLLYRFNCKDFNYLLEHKDDLKDVLTYLGDDFDTFVSDY